MTVELLAQLLQALITDAADNTEVFPDAEGIAYTRTYQDAGLLTRDQGIVVYTADGSEFTITVNQRR